MYFIRYAGVLVGCCAALDLHECSCKMRTWTKLQLLVQAHQVVPHCVEGYITLFRFLLGFMTFQSNQALHLSDTAELPVVIEYKSGSSALDRL